jgi:lipopolysaccharide export system permease protein
MILQRYIGVSLARGWLLVLLVLGAIFGLIGFIEEVSHTDGNYTTVAAARYTLLNLPNQLVNLAPIIALLGSIVALANLDRFNELTIISCTGFSLGKLLSAIALPTMLLTAGLWLCMEYITPQLHQSAEGERRSLRTNDNRLPDGGVWSTNGRRYIHLGKMLENGIPGDISLFEFENENKGQLIRALHARTAVVSPDRSWMFQGVREKRLTGGELVSRKYKELEIANLWAANELPTLSLSRDSMTLSVLYRYSQYLASNGQPMEKYLRMFWQKLLMPLTVFAMVLLATPISASIASGRDRSFGINIGIGAVVGILFYLGAQIIFALGQLLQLNIPIIAVSPAIIILLCALVLLKRMRW